MGNRNERPGLTVSRDPIEGYVYHILSRREDYADEKSRGSVILKHSASSKRRSGHRSIWMTTHSPRHSAMRWETPCSQVAAHLYDVREGAPALRIVALCPRPETPRK